jgi:hypothetical protein
MDGWTVMMKIKGEFATYQTHLKMVNYILPIKILYKTHDGNPRKTLKVSVWLVICLE